MKVFFEHKLDNIFNKDLLSYAKEKFITLSSDAIETENNTLRNIKNLFNLTQDIKNINVFDNSQFYNQYKMGGMISWNVDVGFNKKAYRVFTFPEHVVSDFHMMKEMISKRVDQVKKSNESVDLFILDGGVQQKSAIMLALEEKKFTIDFICIAKGKERNARDETFFTATHDHIKLQKGSHEILFLEKLRDEAHNFIINKVRAKKRMEVS